MLCTGCGFNLTVDAVPASRRCNACGGTFCFDSDDFLLRGYGAPGRSIRMGQVEMGRLVERVIRENSIALVEAPVGCHPAGQEVVMFDGTLKKVEDIVVGDQLCGDSPERRTVLKLIHGERGSVVTITPVKGRPWKATLDHVLTVVDSVTGRVTDLTVEEWLKQPKWVRGESKLFRKAATFKRSSRPLPMDPYFLGLLLGDAHLAGGGKSPLSVTTLDPEIVATLKQQCAKYGMLLAHNPKYPLTYRLSRTRAQMGMGKKGPMTKILFALGLWPIRCEDRFVPHMFKAASFTDRLSILAGLLDTDGSLSQNCYDYISKSPTLADDVAFLARSVELAAYVSPCQKSAYPGHSDTYYRVGISGETSKVPCRIKRKKATVRQQKKDALRTGFTVSDTVELLPYYGFVLDGNGRYLLGDFTVTHNSGKSDAYGVPAVNAVLTGSKLNVKGLRLPKMLAEQANPKPRIVISTAKKNLQHQIAEKDLPFIVHRHDENTVRVALLKGKGNYACRLKASGLDPADRGLFLSWLEKSPTEDLSDFPGKRPPSFYDVTAEDCIGRGCQYARSTKDDPPECKYWASKLNAAKANIVVTNHAVAAFDLRLGPGVILGPYTTLILDEAHQAPASFRSAFSQTLRHGGANKIIRQILEAAIPGGFSDALRSAWKGMFDQLKSVDGEIPKDPFGNAGIEAAEILHKISTAAHEEAVNLGYSSETDFSIDAVKEGDREQLMAVLALKKTIERSLPVFALAKEPDNNTCLYVESNEKGQKSLTLAPISVGKLVGPKLQMIPSVVFTSATLATAGKFDDLKYQLGLNWPSYSDETGAAQAPKQIHELILSTPFNYDKQALLYVPRHIPFPASENQPGRDMYILALVNECTRLIQASNGNAFILFTARKDLEAVYAGLEEAGLTQPLIRQEDDAAVAFKKYMATPNAVLVGLKSFWEGVDIPGDKLHLVIITKLPFPMLTDPVLQAKSRQIVAEALAQGIDERTAQSSTFSKLQVPALLTDLRQGAGRLIRSKTDRGVLAILDTRIFNGNGKARPGPEQRTFKGYGALAVESIGFNRHVFDYSAIASVYAYWAANP